LTLSFDFSAFKSVQKNSDLFGLIQNSKISDLAMAKVKKLNIAVV
jgi:hypothetical protein